LGLRVSNYRHATFPYCGNIGPHSTWLSVIVSVYVTSHGFILLTCGPGAAMLVPPAPQYETAEDHRQTNPNIGSHHNNTILLIIAQALTHENGNVILGVTSRKRMPRTRKTAAMGMPGGSNFVVVIAVLQLLYTEGRMTSGFFLKKKPPRTQLNSAHELENCSRTDWFARGT
jgi:hypothetical protein